MLAILLTTALALADDPRPVADTAPVVDARPAPRLRPITPGVVALSSGLSLAGSFTSVALGMVGPPYVAERTLYTHTAFTVLGAGVPLWAGTSGGAGAAFGGAAAGYAAGGVAAGLLGAAIGASVAAASGDGVTYGIVVGGGIGIVLGGAAGATLGACLATEHALKARAGRFAVLPSGWVTPDGGGVQLTGRF